MRTVKIHSLSPSSKLRALKAVCQRAAPFQLYRFVWLELKLSLHSCYFNHSIYFQSWGKSIKDFFSSLRDEKQKKQTTESVMIVDNSKNSILYAVYINGEPVYSRNVSFKSRNNQIVSYTFMSWSVFSRSSDFLFTSLALLCFILGLILLVTPCVDDEDEKCEEAGCEKCAEDYADDLKKGLLEDQYSAL